MTDEELKNRFDSLRIQGAKTNKKRTEEDLLARFNYLQSQGSQQVQEPVANPMQDTINRHKQIAANSVPYTNLKQQVAHNIQDREVKNNLQAEIQRKGQEVENKIKSGQKITDPEDIKALARAKGLDEKDTEYIIGLNNEKNKIRKLFTQTDIPGANFETLTNASRTNLERNYATEFGKKEANQEGIVAGDTTKYLEYRDKEKEAKANNDYRAEAKYGTLRKQFEADYKKNMKEPETTDVVKTRKDYQEWANTVANGLRNYQNATTPEQKQLFAQELIRDKASYDNAYKKYADALTYDELKNNNLIIDSEESFRKNVLGGTANIINAGYTLGGTLTGSDATTINPEALIEYNRGTDYNNKDLVNILTKLNPTQAVVTTATGIAEGPGSAFVHLKALKDQNPYNKRLETLYNQIATRTYNGTVDDLRNELDTIQKEIYQNFKDVYTQDELDAVADQLRHNEVYGNFAAIPNAFGTTGNMVPSILLGTATGGLGEVFGGGSMAAAGTVANGLQQAGAMGSLGAGAYSQAMDEALQNGASYNQAQLYGALSGATEVGTEMLGGESVNRFLGQTGKSALGKVFGKAIDNLNIESKVGRIVANTISDVAGESTEEMISEALNPLWKAITYDPNALPQNADEMGEYIKNILKAGAEAIPSTLLMQGAGAAGNVVKTQQVENGIIKSINESDLSQIVKNQLINEVRKASTDVKLGLEEADYMQDKAYEKGFNLAAQSEQMKQRIPEGYSLPQSTIDILAYTENNRPGLNIAFDTNIQGNGTFVENPDGTRTITLNPNSKRAVEFTLTHELGHDLKGTQEYTQLQNLLTDYAKGKPGYQEALNQLDKTYKESGANFNLEDEATNDMLGQAIGEQEFYNKLAENPTLFNRVTNGLKNLLGNKDTKLKNKIEKLTSNALKQEYSGKQEGTQESLPTSVDSKGRELSQGVQRYFRNQAKEGLDADGNLLVLYHGTPQGTFTVFKDGTYLTPNKDYADRYQSTSASSLGNGAKTASNPKTYEVYAKIEHPFVLTDKKAKDIYINEYIKGGNALGISPYESNDFYNELDLIDWTEGEDLREWLKENHPEYDSIILYEGADGGYGEEVTDRGDSILVFNPNQIKSVDNFNPTENPDINYSLSEAPTQDNQGRELSQGQQTYFRDSKVRDNEGRLVRVYHMTNDNFNKVDFRKNAQGLFWFASSKEDLLNGSVSANGTRNKANSNIKEMYVNMKKPATWEEYDRYGIGQLQEMGYDGILLDEGDGTFVGAIFDNANQVKNIDNLTPTNNADMRYQKQNQSWQQFLDKNLNLAKGTKTYFPTNEELTKAETKAIENEPVVKLTESEDDTLFSLSEEEQREVNNYIENLTNDDSIPDNIKNDLIDRLNNVDNYNDFKELVKEVRRYNVSRFTQDRKSAEGTRGQTIKGKDIREAIDKNVGIEKGNRKVIQDTIKSMNKDMIEGNLTDSKIDEYVEQLGNTMKSYASEYYEQYKGFKDYLRKTKIYVPPEIKRGITDYNDFRKANMGNLVLTSDPNNMTPDQVYKELQEKYGDLLPDDIINPIDQLEHLAEISSKIKVEEGKLRDMLEKQYGKDAWEGSKEYLKRDLKELRDAPKVEQEDLDLTDPNEKKRSWTETSKSNELVREFLDVKDATYVPASNKKQLNYAKAQVDRMGYDEAIKFIDGKINLNERFKAEDIAIGEYLIQEAIKKGDYEKAQDMIQNVAIIGTELGQAVQAMSMIARMTPEGQLKYLNKVVNRLNENIDKKNQKRAEDKQIEPIKLEKEFATDILKATDDVELQQAMDRALQRLADQMPVNIGDKIAEWRYLAMLANPRTHIRNMVANVGMKTAYGTKNIIQRAIETIAKPIERSRTFEKATEDVKNFTNRTAQELDGVLAQTDNKTIEGRIKEMRKVFKFAPLEKLRRLNSNALSWEDNVFTRRAFKNNLNEYLTANGIKTQQDIDLNPEIVQKGINFAKEEAWKTTFHQASKFATELNRIENINGFSKLIVGGTVPFKKTPINIAKTGASYSPLGLLETLSAETVKLKRGDIDANQYIDRLSQGLTGTALFGLGAFLSKLGILKAGTDDEDEYAEAIGQTMKYSLRFGDRNYDISWAAPSAMPLLMGAELVDATEGKDVTFGDIAETLASSINPLSEMSFVSGLNSTIKSYSNSDSPVDAIGAAIKNSLRSYFGQFVPTIGGQINKIIDDTERNTTATKASKWKEGETFLRQQVAKIPGASFALEPKTDIWGNEKKRDENPLVRAIDALVNPGTVTKDRTTKVDTEIMSLIDVLEDNSIRPQIPKNNFKYNNEEVDLTSPEYTKYKKAYGKYLYETYDALLDDEYYKTLEATDKAKVLKDISNDATNIAKNEVGYQTDGYFKYDVRKDELDKAGIPLVDYYLIGRDIKSNDSKSKKQNYISEAERQMDAVGKKITKEQKTVLKDIFGVK